MTKKKVIQMQAAPLPKITAPQAEQAMIGAWRILDEIKAGQEFGRPMYLELMDFLKVDGTLVCPVAPEDGKITLNQISWACALKIVTQENLVFTLPKKTAEWFVEYSRKYNALPTGAKFVALQELYEGKAEVVARGQ